MFMKHYAPNRCLYIKVAKLRVRGGVGLGGQGRCEQRSEVIVKNKKKNVGGVGGGIG